MRPRQFHRYQFYIFPSNSTINIDDNILGIPMKYAVAYINNLPNDRRRAHGGQRVNVEHVFVNFSYNNTKLKTCPLDYAEFSTL